jgi:WD40 repeat protein
MPMLFKKHKNAVASVAFSPDGLWIVSGSADRSVRVWNSTTKKEALTYVNESHHPFVNDVARVAFIQVKDKLMVASFGILDKYITVKPMPV